jgi:hypothetical protein
VDHFEREAPDIHVGDEVIYGDLKGIVVREVYYLGADQEPFTVIWYGDHMSSRLVADIKLTGKKYPQIAEIIKELKQ